MFHRPYSGDGAHSSGYNSGSVLLGWVGPDADGQMSLQSEQVAGIAVQDPQNAAVTLLATVDGRLMELGVPVTATHDGPPAGAQVTCEAAADAVMPARVRTAICPSLGFLRAASRDPGTVPAAACRPARRSRRPKRARPPVLHHPLGAPQQRKPGDVRPFVRHLLRGDVASLA